MIDEELYQQAADELNSDRRRPHIWARACALASDDHDEARFLYTNLRVEELLAEQASGVQSSTSSSETDNDSTLALAPIDETASEDDIKGFLDDIDLTDGDASIPSSISAPSGIDTEKSREALLNLEPLTLDLDPAESSYSKIASTKPGVDDHLEPDADLMADYVPENPDVLDDTYAGDNLEEEDFEKELANFKAEQNDAGHLSELSDEDPFSSDDLDQPDLDNTTNFSLDADEIAQFQAPEEPSKPKQLIDLDPSEYVDADLTAVNSDDLTQANIGVLDAHTNELDEMLEEARYQPGEPEISDPEMDWLDDEPFSMDATSERETSAAREPTIIEPDPYTDELNRQADELDLGHSDDQTADYSQQIAEDLSQDKDFPEPAQIASETPTDNPIPVAAAASASAAALVASAPDLSSPGLRDKTDSHDIDNSDYPLDLTHGRKGKNYSVYRRNNQIQAVKSGVSWSALFLTLPYLVYRHLFGTALAYIVLWIVAIGGLVLSGLVWLDTGANVTPLVQACTIGFALLTFIGLIYLPFRYGNSWRSDKLETRGFEMVALAKARNPGRAIARARRHSALDG